MGTVTEQAVAPDASAQDVSARLQERIRAFTGFYEQHAYLAYNLALRITCEPEPAEGAVKLAFLRQLDPAPTGLLPATVGAALHEAPTRPEPNGAGAPEAERVLAASAELAAPERAALALADLAHTGPEGIGAALGIDEDQAGKLLHRAREGLAARLGLPRAQADEVAREWMWAAPPEAVWQKLYAEFHRTVERQLRRGSADEQTLVLTPAEAAGVTTPRPEERRRLRPRTPRLRRPRWSRRRWLVVGPVLVVLAAGGLAAAKLTRVGSSSRHPNAGPGFAPAPGAASAGAPSTGSGPADPGVTPHKPLTPAELDRLRLRELKQLNEYSKRQADNRLPADKRQAAAQGIAGLQRAADRRMSAELKREQRLRDQLARERAKAKAPPPPPPPSAPRTRTPPPSRSQPPKRQTTTTQPAPGGDGSKQTCLLDEDSGQYICAQ